MKHAGGAQPQVGTDSDLFLLGQCGNTYGFSTPGEEMAVSPHHSKRVGPYHGGMCHMGTTVGL